MMLVHEIEEKSIKQDFIRIKKKIKKILRVKQTEKKSAYKRTLKWRRKGIVL